MIRIYDLLITCNSTRKRLAYRSNKYPDDKILQQHTLQRKVYTDAFDEDLFTDFVKIIATGWAYLNLPVSKEEQTKDTKKQYTVTQAPLQRLPWQQSFLGVPLSRSGLT